MKIVEKSKHIRIITFKGSTNLFFTLVYSNSHVKDVKYYKKKIAMYLIPKQYFPILLRVREISTFIFLLKKNFPQYFIRTVFLKFKFHDLFYLHMEYSPRNFLISNNLYARLKSI